MYFQLREEFYGPVNGFFLVPSDSQPVFGEPGGDSHTISILHARTQVRYVDDTLVIWPHGPGRLQSFHQHLNCQHPTIHFAVEEEKDNKLPFLDVMVTKKGGRLLTSV